VNLERLLDSNYMILATINDNMKQWLLTPNNNLLISDRENIRRMQMLMISMPAMMEMPPLSVHFDPELADKWLDSQAMSSYNNVDLNSLHHPGGPLTFHLGLTFL
jgi:hypothetical protein